MPSNLVAIDTNILIYLTAPDDDTADEAQILLREKARHLFLHLREHNNDIALPSVVVGEFLSHTAYSEGNRLAQALAELQRQFVILNFDTRSAEIYAQLMHHRKEGEIFKRYKMIEGLPRAVCMPTSPS